LLLVASDLGAPQPAAAFGFGGFGHMGGGFGGHMGGGSRMGTSRMTAPRGGTGRSVGATGGGSTYRGNGTRGGGTTYGGNGTRGSTTYGGNGTRGGTTYGSNGTRGNMGSGERGPGHHPPIGTVIERNVAPVVAAPPPPPPPPPGGIAANPNIRSTGVPPQGERRFVNDEIVTAFASSATPQAIEQIARKYNLTRLESQNFALTGTTLYRWRVGGRRSVADTVGAMEDERIVASAQPNYVYSLQEDLSNTSTDKPAAGNPPAEKSSTAGPAGDAAQYVLEKLQIEAAHHVATGKNIAIAVIDSEIDTKHPDLDATITKSYDALGGENTPQQHGTAIAGAIAAHKKLLGIAPGTRLFAERAFDSTPGEAKGKSFAIYKAIQWAADNGARVVNMSFTGPADPQLHRMLAAAYAKDIVLVAAAGNAGPTAAPLYPGADPYVIAVSATDSHDDVFAMTNRGQYIAVAAPGVEILALAPDDSYQVTTGTSVAAAHISGIVALLLEIKPSLKPADIRAIIMSTAEPLAPLGQPSDVGAGVANAYRAVVVVNGKPVEKDGDAQAKQ
jgi:hypothetical protein